MKKLKSYKKEIRFEIGKEDNVNTLIEIADSPEGEEIGLFSFQTSTAKGVTFGRKLGFCEREGRGLPEADNNLPKKEFHFEFDVRFVLDEADDIELLIAEKDSGTYLKFMLKGLSSEQANTAVIDFEQQISTFIKTAIYFHAWACYRKQDENVEKRNESYDNIMANQRIHFKNLLKQKNYKVIEESEKNGIKIVTSESIERGRNPRTRAELEKQKQEFLEELFDGFKEFRKNHRRKTPKQKDLRPYIYKRLIDREKKISEMLSNYQLDFAALWQSFLSSQKKEDFLSIAVLNNKIGSC